MTEETGKQAATPELDELARRLLDLWQDQLGAMAANPDLAAQAARLMAAMPLPGMWLSQLGQMGDGPGGDLAKSWARMSQAWMAQDWWKGASGGNGEAKTERPTPASAATPGAATAAAASQPRGGDLDELSHRLAGIERRLEQLAEQSAERKRKPAKPPVKPRPAGSKPAARKPRRADAADPKGGSGGADGGASG